MCVPFVFQKKYAPARSFGPAGDMLIILIKTSF